MRLLWEKSKSFFQNIYYSGSSYVIEHYYKERLKQSLAQLAPVCEQDFVLDLGCGFGKTTLWIKEFYAKVKVIGLDSDSSNIKKARQRAKTKELPTTFISFSGYTFPFPDEQFDKVLICFLEKPPNLLQYQNTLEEIYRVLQPQGELLFAAWQIDKQAAVSQKLFCSEQLWSYLQQTGFLYGEKLSGHTTPWGNIDLFKAKKQFHVHKEL